MCQEYSVYYYIWHRRAEREAETNKYMVFLLNKMNNRCNTDRMWYKSTTILYRLTLLGGCWCLVNSRVDLITLCSRSFWDLLWCLDRGLTPSAAVSPVPTHVGLERLGSGGLRPVWNPECTNLFPALVMVSPARPGTFLEPSSVSGYLFLEPAVSAQPRFGSVRWVSLAKNNNHLQLQS